MECLSRGCLHHGKEQSVLLLAWIEILGVIPCAPLSVTSHSKLAQNHVGSTFKALPESDRCPHLHVATPAGTVSCPCVLAALLPFSYHELSSKESGCVPSAWMAPRAKSQAFQSLQSSAEAAPSPSPCLLQPTGLNEVPPAFNRPNLLCLECSPASYLPGSLTGVLDFGQMPPSP